MRKFRLRHLSLALIVACAAVAHAAAPDGFAHFITRSGDQLVDGTRVFHWVSLDAPDTLQIITNYRFDADQPAGRYRLPDEYELRDCVRSVRQLGGQVMRVFVITVHRGPAPDFDFDVSTSPATPNEAALRVLDRLLAICNQEHVRLIIPLVAYNSGIRGDWHTYGEDFWKVGSPANREFKDVVRQVLMRTNTVTGRPYRDDKAILGWQTGNELVIGQDPARRAWLHDFAAYVKTLDHHHLLIDGRNRPTDVYNHYDEFAADPNLDAISYHTYRNLPQADTPAGTLRLMRAQLRGKKPLIVTEIAMYTPPRALRALLDEMVADGTVGGNWWALRFHNRDGGFYRHSDRGSKFEDLHWPGFTSPAIPDIAREREVLGILGDYAARISGHPQPAPTVPEAPRLLPARDPGHLSWRGSTGATGYDIQRAPTAAGPWVTLAANVPDNLVAYAPQYCDATTAAGGTYFYRVIARNSAGASPVSNVIGPIRSPYRWLVDECFDRSHWDPSSANLTIDCGFGHDEYLDDLAVVRRADPGKDARLVYHVPGLVRSITFTLYAAEVAPRILLHHSQGAASEVTPDVRSYDGGRRARYTATFPAADAGDTIEIQLRANAAARQAIGRVEVAWTPSP